MKVLSSLITAAVVARASALTQDEKLRLLRRAVPLSSRKLNNNNNNAAAAITSAESIQFNACVSLTALPEDQDQEFIASSDEMKTLFEQGDIVSQTSVVLFSICTTGSCTGSDEGLYVTDLGSYMQLTGYRPQKTFDYCEVCKESQDYCEYVSDMTGQCLPCDRSTFAILSLTASHSSACLAGRWTRETMPPPLQLPLPLPLTTLGQMRRQQRETTLPPRTDKTPLPKAADA
jgi:hypothetical protein